MPLPYISYTNNTSPSTITPDPMELLHSMEDTLASAILKIGKSHASNALNIKKQIDARHQTLLKSEENCIWDFHVGLMRILHCIALTIL